MTATNVQCTTADGQIFSGTDTWANITAGVNLTVDDTFTDWHVGASPGPSGQIYMGYAQWDTSAIPDTDVVSDVSLQLWSQFNPTENFTMEVYAYDWGSSLDTGDWRTPTQLQALTRVATFWTANYTPNSTWVVCVSDAAFLTAINTTGMTKLLFTSHWQRSDTAPSGTGGAIEIYSGNSGATWSWPWLYITHAAPVAANPQSRIVVPTGAVQRASSW